ncbi:FHA domain-containing protein [Nocardioides abyssi]|uniref:FHA domain-containing protein n=1 Tax=Nocardioides abyssi TaxID=3058370 RepID=A0ABT8EUZ1_9ACTN|nr:FHA domain-containing protein [Nocardioides abyssi]MDN4161945.1 FHA domain-containing protein [Nocardioides abyssi]
MPFCTACGRQNPDDARFCSQCGTKLVTADESTAPATPVGQGDSTATIQIGLGDKTETSDRQLNPVDAAAVDALPAGHALLVVQRGPGSGSRFLLDSDVVTAGRHPESEIFLDDVTVSRRHAQFDRTGDTFTVSDVGSLNGTYVNRDRIDKVQLKDGDEVQIGKYRLVFFAGHQAG